MKSAKMPFLMCVVISMWAVLVNGCGSGVGKAVAIAQRAPYVARSGTFTFTATISGTASSPVTWSVQESNGGSITTAGVYTAPAIAGTYHVVATSQLDSTQSDVATVTVNPASTLTVPQMAGNWAGTWQDTTSGASGNATLNIVVDNTAKTVTYALGMTGAVLGLQFGPPNPETLSGTFTTTSVALAATSATFGTIAMTVDTSAVINVTCTSLPPVFSFYNKLQFNGTATATTIQGNFVVRNQAGGINVGTVVLTKQ